MLFEVRFVLWSLKGRKCSIGSSPLWNLNCSSGTDIVIFNSLFLSVSTLWLIESRECISLEICFRFLSSSHMFFTNSWKPLSHKSVIRLLMYSICGGSWACLVLGFLGLGAFFDWMS